MGLDEEHVNNVMEWVETDYRAQVGRWSKMKESKLSKKSHLHNIDDDGNYICQFYLGRVKKVNDDAHHQQNILRKEHGADLNNLMRKNNNNQRNRIN